MPGDIRSDQSEPIPTATAAASDSSDREQPQVGSAAQNQDKLLTVPRTLSLEPKDKRSRREWFARIRIREDRLARLWVSNLAGHDVVVWSNKEKRWVALLGVPDLRRAIDVAETEMTRIGASRPPNRSPSGLARLPGSLPPAPPLAMLHSAAAGVGELRLRSIAQNQGAGTIGKTLPSEVNQAPLQPRLPRSNKRRGAASANRNTHLTASPSGNQVPRQAKKRWHWQAMERVLWIASGVFAMFMISGAGSADEKSPVPDTPAILLTADRYDPSWVGSAQSNLGPTLGQILLGPRLECPVQPTYCQPPLTTSDSESQVRPTLAEEAPREEASTTKQRVSAEAQTRAGPAPSSNRGNPEHSASQPDVPADLNFPAVRAALFNAAALARTCRGESIGGKAVVTFDPSGTVRNVEIPLLIGERPDRGCIVQSFKGVRIPPFSGRAIAVKKDF